MNAKNLIAAVAVFAVTGSAFAVGSDETIHYNDVKSTKTRAEVMAELRQSQLDGSYAVGGYELQNPVPGATVQFARNAQNATETAQNSKAGASKSN